MRGKKEREVLNKIREQGSFEEMMNRPLFPDAFEIGAKFLSDKDVDVHRMLNDWIFHPDSISIAPQNFTQPPEKMWDVLSLTEKWKDFALLAIRTVSLAVSEAEVERVLYREHTAKQAGL
jgi:hypothetical protein